MKRPPAASRPFLALVATALFAAPVTAAAPAFEGPLPADRTRDLSPQQAPMALTFGAQAQAMYFERDAYVGGAVFAGVTHRYLNARVTLPLLVRVYDLDHSGPALGPAACTYVSCNRLVDPETGRIAPLRLLSLIDRFEINAPYHLGSLRAGPLTFTQNEGALVSNMQNRWAHNDRQTALALRAGFPDGRVKGEVHLADIEAPLSFVGASISARPGAFFAPADAPWWLALLGRARIGLDVAADAMVGDASPESAWMMRWPGGLQGLYGGAVSAAWPLLAEGQLVQFEPMLSGSVLYGLRANRNTAPFIGAGAQGGAALTLRLPYVAWRTDVRAGVSSAAHRHQVFGPLYVLERRGALGTASGVGTGTVLQGSTPAGLSARAVSEVKIGHWVRTGGMLTIDSAPGRNLASLFVEVGAGGAHLYGAVYRRGFSGRFFHEGPQWDEAIRLDDAWLGVFAADAALWGPISVYGRAALAPRWTKAGPRQDLDVSVGLSSALDLVADPSFWP